MPLVETFCLNYYLPVQRITNDQIIVEDGEFYLIRSFGGQALACLKNINILRRTFSQSRD